MDDYVSNDFGLLMNIVGWDVVSESIVNPFGKVWPQCFIVVSENFPLVRFGMVLGHEDGCENRKVVR